MSNLRSRSRHLRVASLSVFWPFFVLPLSAQERYSLPVRQSTLTVENATIRPLTARDAARDDRWLGVEIRDVRWAPDGSVVYFRWNLHPTVDDDPEADPWFRVDRDAQWVERVPDAEVALIPGDVVTWSLDATRGAWVREGAVYLFDSSRAGDELVWRAVALADSARSARTARDGKTVTFEAGERLFQYGVDDGRVSLLVERRTISRAPTTQAGEWLRTQQLELFEHLRREADRRNSVDVRRRAAAIRTPQSIPVSSNTTIDEIQLSPDGRFVTFRARAPNTRRPRTQYVDYVHASGYSRVGSARPKVGEPRDTVRMGIVRFDPTVHPDSVDVTWVVLPEAGDRLTIPHGPFWSLEGDRAVIQIISADHKDLWIATLDFETGNTTVVSHDHDDAWIGGPPIQANYRGPALLEWLPAGRFVFASERSGWSHLYLVNTDGSVSALTEGPWEVRNAVLSRDRSTWLLQASREHPSDDHLYLMPAAGGPLTRLTQKAGRHSGSVSPDGARLALVYGETIQLPDLFLRDVTAGASDARVTVSGTDAYYEHPLVRPDIVSFPHPDAGQVWGALFTPTHPDEERAAVIHVHGGGYRQFSHRGWTVYGYALHLGLINYLVQRGYTVLDFDYRGSAGFGRDYRTDIAQSMGIKDADGTAAAAQFLAAEHGVDPNRIGIYGISYGGFLTLMALFRYPSVFAAGVANAAVTDWAHYNDRWTSRILGVPHEDPEAYRRSSPIYYAEGLEDHLLIVHGLVDDNVHFQDAARLTQRLIELEKDFEVMYYPAEPHTIQTEDSRYDYVRRVTAFFDRHLRGR